MASADGSILIRTTVDKTGLTKGLSELSSIVGKLAPTMLALFGVKKLLEFGKASIEVASDLHEVQNVVDVSFGEMSYKIEEFADTAIENFGISELTAKSMASTFMAMSNGMKQGADVASDMAVEMTGRLADISSFYNKTTDEIETIGRAVYSGETEPLKQIGVIMTEAQLQTFALSRGYSTLYKNMSAADQLFIRQQYFLDATNQAAGDFVNTQNSWANQTRILSERWKEFMSIVGSGLITILTPIVQLLNSALSILVAIAESIGSFATNVLGIDTKSIESTSKAMDGMTESTDGTTESLNSATDAAKGALAAFDDLDVLQSGGNGGGTAAVAFPDVGELNKEIANKKIEFPELPDPIYTPNWGLDLPFIPQPEFATIADPIYEPSWGLDLPFIPQPEFVPIADPVYEPNWGLNLPFIPQPEFVPIADPIYEPNWNLVPTLVAAFDEIGSLVNERFPALEGVLNGYVERIGTGMALNVNLATSSMYESIGSFITNSELAFATWGVSVGTSVEETAENVMSNIKTMATNCYANARSFIVTSAQAFATWGTSVISHVVDTANNMSSAFVAGLKIMWDSFVSFATATGEKVSGWFSANQETIGKVVIGAAIVAGIAATIATGGAALAPAATIGGAALATVPGLATGAVIPPNRQFMAILGDQKSGVNIETPLQTMVDAFNTALNQRVGNGNSQNIVLNIDGQTFARITLDGTLDELNRRGYNVSVLEG